MPAITLPRAKTQPRHRRSIQDQSQGSSLEDNFPFQMRFYLDLKAVALKKVYNTCRFTAM